MFSVGTASVVGLGASFGLSVEVTLATMASRSLKKSLCIPFSLWFQMNDLVLVSVRLNDTSI